MNLLDGLIDKSRWRFRWRYWRGQTPWDTNITPPEVMAFLATTPPGKALDLGCGTGTNAITLARHGWRVVGVDFAAEAIRTARRKSAAAGLNIDFHVADVTDLGMLTESVDYVLDIGCLFTLTPKGRTQYARNLARLLRPQGWYMLYAWLPRPWKGRLRGIATAEVDTLLSGVCVKERMVIGEEKGHPSAWYWFRRR
ncbi:MAG: class I SAM-dependent methyltransferase [Deltaproteobacteria bacterium]|nr:class I SAM-dependent methyltransferase [Deltaproteobacteria bacterium]